MRSPSGPRWASAAAMAVMQPGCLSGAPESETAPKMPHITSSPPLLPSPLRRLGRLLRLGHGAGPAGAVRRVVLVGGEQRERGAELGARFAVARGREEHGGDGAASERLAPIARRQERRRGVVAEATLV